MKLAPVAAALVALASASLARADTPPTLWDLGKNPDALAQRRQHLQMEVDISTVDELGGDPQITVQTQAMMAEDNARMLAESWHGPKDSWLRFDDAWIAMRRHDYAAAVPILQGLAKELGRAQFSSEIWQKLAECYVRLERTADEIHAYDEVLSRAATDAERLTPLLNQGEAYMRSGDVDVAVTQFRELLALAARTSIVDISLLAHWDLAVALDRSGDFRSGVEEARSTIRMTKVAILVISPINTAVYFVPDYERSWYLALGRAALALDADTPRHAAQQWRIAETAMMDYVSGATRHGNDRWLPLARRRLDEIRKRRAEADKRAGPPPPSPEEVF